jgi:L-ascorbate metabolism protein UlaG (beta-lactamase superfamily)
LTDRKVRFPLAAATIFLLLAFAVTAWRLFSYAPAPVDPGWSVPAAPTVPAGAVTVRFTGTTTLLFSDGQTTWMTDGWFSRPGLLSLLFGEIEPDIAAIASGLNANEVSELAAVIPLHSHYDHAMDAPEIARRTGALLLGSEATANIGRGWGLPESQIRILRDREPVQLGAFTVTPIESRHFPYADEKMVHELIDDWEISEPLVPPVPAFDYKLGKAYMLHVAHPKGRFLIVGSAGFIPGQLEGMDVDLLFLGVGGLGSQTDEYRQSFWEETAARVRAERIVPVHWDSLVGPIQGPFTGEVRIASFFSGNSEPLKAFLMEKAQTHPEITWQVLPRYGPVVIFN